MSRIAGVLKKTGLFVLGLIFVSITQPFGHCRELTGLSIQDNSYFDTDRLIFAGYQIAEKGCTLFIDLDNCNMIVFLDGLPIKAYPVSGGTNDSPSPVGTWKVVDIASWGEGFGGSWIGLNVPWGRYGIHGTIKPWAVGEYNASHGCIRMKDADVEAIKKLVRYGTVVHIKQNMVPFRDMRSGMIGSDIQRTQIMLKSIGYYTGAADGIFGSGMERAVRKFQSAYRLGADGIVGRRTYDTICEFSGE